LKALSSDRAGDVDRRDGPRIRDQRTCRSRPITATFPLTNQKIASLANVPVVAGTVTVVAVDPN
jgi:hypothetical protein